MTVPRLYFTDLPQRSTPHLIRHCFAMPPSPRGEGFSAAALLSAEPSASPRGEAVGASRLMRWNLISGIISRQCRALYFTALPQRCNNSSRPTSSVIASQCHLPLEGKAFLRLHCSLSSHRLPLEGKLSRKRLMRWHLLFTKTLRQCRALYFTALPQRCSSTPRPTSSVIDVAMPPSPQGEVFCRRHPLFPPHPARTSLFSYLFSCFLKKLQVSH